MLVGPEGRVCLTTHVEGGDDRGLEPDTTTAIVLFTNKMVDMQQ
jgi:hypothetical protein